MWNFKHVTFTVKTGIRHITNLFKQIRVEVTFRTSNSLKQLLTHQTVTLILRTQTLWWWKLSSDFNIHMAHMDSRWCTSDFHLSPLTFKDLSHCNTKACSRNWKKILIKAFRQEVWLASCPCHLWTRCFLRDYCVRAAMQFTTYSSAVTVSPKVNHKYTYMFTKHTDFLTYGTSLNSFSVEDKGCFHITDAILVLGVIWWTNVSSPVTKYCKNCSPWLASRVKCRIGSPHMTSFVIICEVLRHPACKHFSVIQLVNLTHLSTLVMACAQTHVYFHSGCCLSPTSVLL